MWLDGYRRRPVPTGVGGGSYANDARCRRNNAVIKLVFDVKVPTIPVAFLFALCDIPAGSEITVAHGSSSSMGGFVFEDP